MPTPNCTGEEMLLHTLFAFVRDDGHPDSKYKENDAYWARALYANPATDCAPSRDKQGAREQPPREQPSAFEEARAGEEQLELPIPSSSRGDASSSSSSLQNGVGMEAIAVDIAQDLQARPSFDFEESPFWAIKKRCDERSVVRRLFPIPISIPIPIYTCTHIFRAVPDG